MRGLWLKWSRDEERSKGHHASASAEYLANSVGILGQGGEGGSCTAVLRDEGEDSLHVPVFVSVPCVRKPKNAARVRAFSRRLSVLALRMYI